MPRALAGILPPRPCSLWPLCSLLSHPAVCLGTEGPFVEAVEVSASARPSPGLTGNVPLRFCSFHEMK